HACAPVLLLLDHQVTLSPCQHRLSTPCAGLCGLQSGQVLRRYLEAVLRLRSLLHPTLLPLGAPVESPGLSLADLFFTVPDGLALKRQLHGLLLTLVLPVLRLQLKSEHLVRVHSPFLCDGSLKFLQLLLYLAHSHSFLLQYGVVIFLPHGHRHEAGRGMWRVSVLTFVAELIPQLGLMLV